MLIPNLLKGDRVKLSALKKEDVDKITMWYEDVDFLRNYDGKIAYPETKESIEKQSIEITIDMICIYMDY